DLTYAIVGGDQSNFEIVGNEIKVRPGAELDFEAGVSRELVIRATDEAGAISESSITVIVRDANEAPIPVNDSIAAIEAGGISNAAAGTNPTGNVLANDTDVDSGDT
ncbi:MAG: hypothetical protein ACK55I_41655, partial [bacterium]